MSLVKISFELQIIPARFIIVRNLPTCCHIRKPGAQVFGMWNIFRSFQTKGPPDKIQRQEYNYGGHVKLPCAGLFSPPHAAAILPLNKTADLFLLSCTMKLFQR